MRRASTASILRLKRCPENAAKSSMSDGPSHSLTCVSFKNTLGDDLSGELVLTPHAPKGAGVTIICHGLDCTKDTGFYPLLSASLPTPSFRFSFRGCGTSSGACQAASYVPSSCLSDSHCLPQAPFPFARVRPDPALLRGSGAWLSSWLNLVHCCVHHPA